MQQYAWLVFALLGALFAAIVNVVSKKALEATDYTIALCIQVLLMVLTLLALATLMHRWPKLGQTPRWAMLALAGSGVAAGLSWFFGYHALQLSHVAKTAPIDKLSMPLAVLMAAVFLRERPSGLNWIGIVIMLVGAACVAWPSGSAHR